MVEGYGDVELTLGYILDEARQDKGHVISRSEAVPESASHERSHARSESWFLSLRSDPQIHVIPQPMVGVDVPVAQICVAVLCKLHTSRLDVGQTTPVRFASLWIQTFVTDSRQDAGPFGQSPHAVVLHSLDEVQHVEVIHPPEKVHLSISVT